MPKKGFKSITVADNIYDRLYKHYESHREELTVHGIFSFSGYVTNLLFQSIHDQDQYPPLRNTVLDAINILGQAIRTQPKYYNRYTSHGVKNEKK